MRAAAHNPQITKLLDLVSPRTGIIRSLNRVARSIEEPSPPILYHALLSNFDFRKAESHARSTAGKGMTDDDAIGGAIGEAIERYCATHPVLSSIRRARLAELDLPAITPQECVLYSAAQYARSGFPHAEWSDDSEIGWARVKELPSEHDIFAPAFLIYSNYFGPNGEDGYCPPTSNGLAAGPDLQSAILSGLCELAERDGFLAHWMNRLPAPEVNCEDGVARDICAHYWRFGVETRVFNLTADLPMYVMMAVSLSPADRGPSALVALGCHLDPNMAVRKALFEICQVRPGETRRFFEDGPHKQLHGYSDIKTLQDHSGYFMLPERRHEFAFLLESGRRQTLSDLPSHASGNTARDVETAVEGLIRAGCRVAYADLTTPDVQPFGIRVVRTLATGLQPIHFGCGEERLGGRRLFELPLRLGYTEHPTTESELNPCPHPLA
ncbi:MAG TPA: YcaO-like family protein [Bryobacteraceae bacterium]|nr:YcaO-like family protein [Bryobacteraceae bacterium]